LPSKPRRGVATGSRTSAGCCAWIALLACAWLACLLATPTQAGACPNEALRSGVSEHLPDCRAYEQVSPVDKGGVDAVTLQPLFPAQSSACEPGEACAIAYMNVASAFDGAQGNELPNAYMAERGAGGWQTTALTPPTLQPPANAQPKVSYAFSADLSQAVLRVPLQRLTENAPAGVYNLYLREADGGYSLVTALPPPEPPPTGCGSCFATEDVPAFAGASSDFRHIIFETNDSLLAGAPGGGMDNLYEAAGERVRLVGILPDERVASEGSTAAAGIDPIEGTAGELDHAISQDGSRVLFEAKADGGEPDTQQEGKQELYDRLEGSSTIEVSAPAPGAQPSRCETRERVCAAERAQFWGASADGSVVFFTSRAALTKKSFTGTEAAISPLEEEEEEREEVEEERGEKEQGTTTHRRQPGDDLYVYDVDTRTLADLTADPENGDDPDGADVLGVVGSSEDGSYVYFVAEGHLAAGAPSGESNLYVWHGTAEGAGTTSFIATLQAGKGESGDAMDWSEDPRDSQAYVTPGGEHLAFMSVKPLTGYDNEDQAAGERGHETFDHEVFEYSVETGQLVCASCDPSGARPVGSAFIGAKLTERVSTPFHQPRTLSDDGSRLFFSSPDPLVPGLAGGSVKVFEYEDGSPQIISGMGSNGNDVFLDASASGNDVFFATREQLIPDDDDELVDVYDARVDGGLQAPPASTPPCEDGACQGESGPPAFLSSSPISATFAGAGNLVPPSAEPRLTDKQLLARALAKCRRLTGRKRRATCVAHARRYYVQSATKGGRARSHRRRPAAKRR
jgi:hypothetical protein